MFRHVAVALVAACGCGRVGFESLGDGGTVGDGGTPISLELPAGGEIDALAVGPDGTWYAVSESAGAWRSTDQMTWQRCASGYVENLSIAGDGTIYAAAGPDGVRISTDRCATWTLSPVDRRVIDTVVRGSEIYALVDIGLRVKSGATWTLVQNPADGTAFVAGASNGTALVLGTYGSHVVVNSGGGYTRVTTGIGTPTVEAIAVGATRSYAQSTATTASNGAISCASNANLTTWNVCFGGGGIALAVDPTDDTHVVFAPYDQLGQTEDAFGGFDLDKQQFDMDAGNVYDLAFTATGGVLAATVRGVFFAADRTLHWQARHTGIAAWDVNDIVEHDGDIYLATQGGVMRSADGTAPFTISTRGMILSTSGENIVFAPDGSLIAGSRAIWRSPDLGQTWTDLYLPPGADDYRAGVFAFDGMRMFAGSHTRMLYADPPWTTWTPVQIAGQNHFVLSIAVTPDHHIWVGTGEGLFESTDGGVTYQPVPAITYDVGGLLVLADGGLVAATRMGTWISDPARATWTQYGPAEVTFRHAEIPGGLAAATDDGVYISRDRAVTWTLVPGTDAFSTRAAYFDRGSGELVYGTIGHGLQRAPLP